MSHEFIILKDGKLNVYTNYEDIPSTFDHVIKFLPEVPSPPHNEEQHREINDWQNKLQRLLEIEKQNEHRSNSKSTRKL